MPCEGRAIEGAVSFRPHFLVTRHNALGMVAWRTGDYKDALHWLRLAEDEQTRFGGKWIPGLDATRKKLETMVGSLQIVKLKP